MNQKKNLLKLRTNKRGFSNSKYIDHEKENEKNKEMIIKLKEQIIAKDKEISDLKVSKIRRDEQFQRTMKIFEEIVKESDKSTVQGMKLIQSDINNNFNKSKSNFAYNEKKRFENKNEINNYNNKYINNNNYNNDINGNLKEEKFDEFKPKIHLKKSQKKKLNEILNVHSLRLKLKDSNNLINKKDKEIEKLKLENKSSNYFKLQNNYVQNYKELKSIQKEKEKISNKNDDIIKYCFSLEEINKELIEQLEKFKEEFKQYKEKQNNKMKILEDKIEKYKFKERDCFILHLRKEENDFKNEKDNLNNENEIKAISKNVKNLKKEKNIKDEEIKELNLKLKLLNDENNNLNKQVNELNYPHPHIH